MGRFFDFAPPAPWAGGLGVIGEGLSDYADFSEKRRKDQAAQKFMEAQAKAQQAGVDRRDTRETLEFNQRQAKLRGETTTAIGKALGAGAFGQAQAIGAASQFENPKTHQLEGVQVAQKPLGPAPVAPVEPEAPQIPDYVQTLTPAQARAQALAKGLGGLAGEADAAQAEGLATKVQNDRQTYSAGMTDYGKKRDTFDQQNAAYDQEKAHPHYSVTYPGGQSVDFDPREQEIAKEQEAKDTASKLRQAAAAPGQSPDVAAVMLRQADLIEAQVSNADKAPITNMGSAVQAQGFKAGESALDRTSKENIAATRAKHIGKGLGAGGGGAGLSELIKLKEDGHPDSEIAARAAQLGIPAGGKTGWLQATKEVTRGGAITTRLGERDAGLQVTDENGQPLGKAKGPQEAMQLSKSNKAFAQLKERLTALIADVQQNGDRVLLPEATQRRNSLMAAFNAAARVYNGLGATDASQKLEAEISSAAGSPGHGFLMGANLDVLKHVMQEAEAQHRARLEIGLRQGSGPAAGAPNPPAGSHLTPEDQAAIDMAKKRLSTNPNDAVAKQVLQLHGM